MNLGFIGTGSMGSILIEAFIQSGAIPAGNIKASNRTKSKAEKLAFRFPELCIVDSNQEAAEQSDMIFICVKPMEYKQVLQDIRPVVHSEQIIISITSPVLVKHLEEMLPCKIAKVIPSITNYERSGATLCIYGKDMTKADCERVESMLSHISTPLRISEQFTRISSDISSCGPAFLAFFIQQFIEAAVNETGISQEKATKLASEMVLGTGQLLTSGSFTPEDLQQRVAVPGGITAEGLKIMSANMGDLFTQLIATTHAKYDDDLNKIEAAFYGTGVE